jgi:hypothetical protein
MVIFNDAFHLLIFINLLLDPPGQAHAHGLHREHATAFGKSIENLMYIC